MRKPTKLLLVIFLLSLFVPEHCLAMTYSVQSLGISPGYSGSFATDINSDGTIICSSMSITDTTGVFVWSCNNDITDLSGHGIYAFAGINNRGQTAGLYTDTYPDLKFEPLIRNADGTENRLHNPEGVTGAWVQKMLDDSSIFCTYEYRDEDGELTNVKPAIIDSNGKTTFIEAPEGNASVNAISNNGNVIVNNKYLWTASGGFSALSWLASVGQANITCVNDLGWVAGMLNGHIVRWDSNGNMMDLGVGVASGINNLGQVVGSINNQGVIWSLDGSITILPTLEGYLNASAYAINDSGQVVGESIGDLGHMAVLWQPVPEPSSILAILCGIGSLAGYAMRKRK